MPTCSRSSRAEAVRSAIATLVEKDRRALVSHPRQGEVWWAESPESKGRPDLVVTRNQAIDVLRTVRVAPVTRTVRSIPTEVSLGPDEGLPTDRAATMDNALAFPKSLLIRRMGALGQEQRAGLCAAWLAAADC